MTAEDRTRTRLRAVPLFARLPDRAIRTIQAGLRIERFRRGAVLSGPGRTVDALTVVLSGRVEVSHPGRIRSAHSDECCAGDWFGADAALLGPADGRTIVVAEDVELAKIPLSCIDDLLRSAVEEALGVPAAQLPSPAQRLVRTITARNASTPNARRPRVGLALSGGGAKAFAHLGVLKVLDDAGISIDLLAGTSAGAIAAAMLCAGKSIPDMFAFADHLRRLVLRRDGMWDFLEPPTVGLIRGERTRSVYHEVLDGKTFEQLLRPLAIPAADLLTGEPVVLRTGYVSDAVRASAGIPGLYAPWPHAGRYLIEGGLVNSLPVDLLRAQGADIVIASQVIGSPAEMRVEPLESPCPNLLALIAARSNAILDRHARNPHADADILIRPEVDHYDVLDYPLAEDLIALGEAAAEAHLPRIRRHLQATWTTAPNWESRMSNV